LLCAKPKTTMQRSRDLQPLLPWNRPNLHFWQHSVRQDRRCVVCGLPHTYI